MGKLDPGHYGKYHADNGKAHAIVVVSGDGGAEDTDKVAVFGATELGSGLSDGVDYRDVKRGDKTGEWTPA